MSDIAIRVQNLSKQYRIGEAQAQYKTLRESLVSTAKRLVPSNLKASTRVPETTIWALNDVSFEIHQGEVVGIIGRNGAGKSTLLKVLAHITTPTKGRVEIHGRVGSLLEVGTGFHNELTGRENIYLNGAILGMKKAEIERKFDEIVDFAEIEKFLDTPVKHYSSGMYMRLAFAVAAHLEPEILLVDEVLAVGDAEFQKKCLGKMGDVSKEGRTVLFVSHNMAAIQKLCKSIILLNAGKVNFLGQPETGIRHYITLDITPGKGFYDFNSASTHRIGSIPIIRNIRLLDDAGNLKHSFLSGDKLIIEFIVEPIVPLSVPQFGIGFDDVISGRVFSVTTFSSNVLLSPLNRRAKVICQIDELPLAPGSYLLSLSAGTNESLVMDSLDYAVSIEVEPSDVYGNGRLYGPTHGRVLVRSKWEKYD